MARCRADKAGASSESGGEPTTLSQPRKSEKIREEREMVNLHRKNGGSTKIRDLTGTEAKWLVVILVDLPQFSAHKTRTHIDGMN